MNNNSIFVELVYALLLKIKLTTVCTRWPWLESSCSTKKFDEVTLDINVVVKTAIIYLLIYLFIGEFVSGAWLRLFFEALCFGLSQTQKKKVCISRRLCLLFFFPAQLQTAWV